MKNRIISVLLTVLFILPLSAGCTPTNEITTDTDKTPQSDTQPQTTDTETDAETEPEPEEVKAAEITVKSFSAGDKISLSYELKTLPDGLDGKIKLVATSEDGKAVEGEFDRTGSAELEAPAKGGVINVQASFVTSDGEVLDTAELRTKDGLIQLTEDGIRLVVAEMTDDEKAHLVAGTGNPKKTGASGGTYEIARLGVPSITVNDGPAGVRYNVAVWYPSIMNITSSWDSELIYSVGEGIGRDSLALGIDVVLGPGMNIQKNVLGGRNFEYCSEDPLLTAYSATAYVLGMQSTGTEACVKHFAANEQETNRGSASSSVTERALREIYLKPFQLTIRDSKPVTVMSSYNPINGVYTSINKDLLTGILRYEWGYKGMVMCDWGSAGAIVDKVNAQNDIKMPGETDDAKNMLAGIRNGTVNREALDLCCEHILYAVVKSPTYRELEMNTKVDFKGNGKVVSAAAVDTIVLLKNDNNALPYAKDTTLAVFGNGAYKTQCGGSGSGGVSPQRTISIIKGINTNTDLNLYDEKHNVFRNCEAHSKTDASKDVAVTEKYAKECADGADAAVIVITRDSSEGADNSVAKGDFTLNDTEFDMIKRVSEAFHSKGKTVTVLINTGSPIEVVSWRELVDAILFIGYPGQNAGESVAKVLSGEVNPNAKTTMSWPVSYSDTPCYKYFPGNSGKTVYYEDIYVGYRYYETFNVKTAYPFGYGLSYTEFDYSDFSVKENRDGTFTASVKVTNRGKTAGREIAQFYVSKPEATLEQPSVELCGFAKTALLQPGESETVTVKITTDDIYSYDTANSRYIVDKGMYKFYSAASAGDMRGEATLEIKDLRVIYDVENRCVPSPEPEHIIKSEYKVPEKKSDEDAIAKMDDVKKSGKAYIVDLKKEYEVGQIEMTWNGLNGPVTISTAGEDQKFVRYDLFESSGLVMFEENLHGIKARYIKIDPVNTASLDDVKVYVVRDEEREEHKAYENLALKKSVKAASVEGNLYAKNAVDGDFSSRWGSLPTGESWLCVDLGEVKHIKGMLLYLEAAWVPYRVEYSTDGKNFTAAASLGSGEVFVKLKDLDFDARYVSFIREGENWFSIYEVEIYG